MDNNATITLVLDSQSSATKARSIKLRVTFQREPRQFSVGGKNKYTAAKYEDINKRLKEYKEEIDSIEAKLAIAKAIAKELGAGFTFDAFKMQYHERAFGKKLNAPKKEKCVTDLAELWEIYEREATCSQKTKDNYKIAFNWIFRKHKKVSIDQLDVAFFRDLSEYIKAEYRKDKIVAHKRKHGTTPTAIKEIEDVTISSYYAGLNAVCEFLAEEDYIDHWDSPFGRGRKKIRRVKKVSTAKKAIKDDHLEQFVNYVPTDDDRALKEFAWCIYMLSFQCGGANPIDIYGFKNKNLQSGELRYIRHKTFSTMGNVVETEIDVPNLAMMIFSKYGAVDPTQPESYIFPFFDPGHTEKQIRNRTDHFNKMVNNGLALICNELNIPTYKLGGARHSQATYLADAMGDDDLIESIAKRMAHNNKAVTQTHYIKLTKNKKMRIKAVLDALVENNTYFTEDNFLHRI